MKALFEIKKRATVCPKMNKTFGHTVCVISYKTKNL